MSSWTEITSSGALAVVVFDAIAAFASGKMEVPYGRVAGLTMAKWLLAAISVAGIAAGVAALGGIAA